MIPDESREIGLAYGAADSPRDEMARRIAFLIDPDGRVAESYASVEPAKYPHEQLESLRERHESRASD